MIPAGNATLPGRRAGSDFALQHDPAANRPIPASGAGDTATFWLACSVESAAAEASVAIAR